VNGLTMRYQLTLLSLMRRAESIFGHKPIVSYAPNADRFCYTYADMIRRAKRLAAGLQALGVQPGDRVAILAWNHHRQLEAFFGIPASGAVLHTLNLRLHPDDLAYIVDHAGDSVLLVDAALLPLLEQFRPQVDLRHVIVFADAGGVPDGMLDYEALLAQHDEREYVEPLIDEWQAAALCYTSGTTGRPKGVLYAHRAITLQCLAWTMADTFGIREAEVMLPLAPMFHINGWQMPFTATLIGATQVLVRPQLDFPTLLGLLEREQVTFTAGITTIWLGLLDYLDRHPEAYQLTQLRAIAIGGAAAPRSMIQGYAERYGVEILTSWGMTETAPMATISTLPGDLAHLPREEQYDWRTRPGYPVPFIELRARDADGVLAPWDGETLGELEVRGPWVAGGYYNSPESADSITEDGWLRTGDIVTIDARGWIDLKDRSKDLIKSGGEWISSVALENALMDHPAVLEAAVIAIPHPTWLERPLAVIVPRAGYSVSEQELLAHLAPRFAKWWLPDAFAFVEQLPHTPTGKFLKRALRDQFHDYSFPTNI
jgi:acyl-CoA synthetase (AMP-forming)/AMP-acid ligase II